MKCKQCKKVITQSFIEAEGKRFHPECFVCKQCGLVIDGGYRTSRGKFYHPKCFREKSGLKCYKCGKVLEDSWIEHQGKKYHEHCLDNPCKICGKQIKGQYLQDKEGNYHQSCYLNRKAPRCTVCDQPIQGRFLKDPWGNKSHEGHGGRKIASCHHCSRFISNATSNGGVQYNDGRKVCGICKLTEVSSPRQIRPALAKVLGILASPPARLTDIPRNVPIQLVDRNTLKRMSRNLGDHGQGFTASNITTEDGKRTKVSYNIYILFGMPLIQFEAVLAHELLHVWLVHKDIRLSAAETEGFCNLGSELVFQSVASEMSAYLLKLMESDPDRIYGNGYRKMSAKLKRYGWQRLKNSL